MNRTRAKDSDLQYPTTLYHRQSLTCSFRSKKINQRVPALNSLHSFGVNDICEKPPRNPAGLAYGALLIKTRTEAGTVSETVGRFDTRMGLVR